MVELLFFIIFLIIILIPLSYKLGKFISESFLDELTLQQTKLQLFFDKIEESIFKLCNVDTKKEMNATEYFSFLFYSNILISIVSFFVLYFQNNLPFKGEVNYKLDVYLILHILSSLITNTCQTHHIPEIHLTPLSNYFIMPLLMFYSSASGIATGLAVIRGFTIGKIGNAHVDVIRSMTRLLFPLSFILSIIFVACGIPNTFKSFLNYETLENAKQTLILGPVAAFEAIKLFGENGLSAFNANSAHPFENPNYLCNFIQSLSILVVPFALIFTIGFWLKNKKQAIIILSVLIFVLISEFTLISIKELHGNPMLNEILKEVYPNWVGKETRIGIIGSSTFEAAISNVSGSANSSLDSFHPIANVLSLFNLSNQSIFGVQGFGTVFTLNFILYTAFFIGLMTGRTPEIFGKKIEKNEMILSSILLLLNPFLVLSGVVVTLFIYPDKSVSFYEHIHYYTRVFYEFASGAASNGSGLEGLNDNTPYWNFSLALVMFIARYGAMASMIFLGESLAKKPTLPQFVGSLKTDTVLFVIIFLFMSLISTILIYFPFIVLGPFAEIFIH